MTRPTRLSTIFVVLLAAQIARADWSPEILIWQNPPEVDGGASYATMAIDSIGHVHIAYSINYHHSSDPRLVRTGFRYTLFDDHGHQLVEDIFISDSLDDSGGYPLIRFFGQDSLWVIWIGGRMDSLVAAQKYVSFNLSGQMLHPVRDFPRPRWPGGDPFAFDVRDDRTVVLADGGGLGEAIYMTVQTPDGQRPMDDEVIWDVPFGRGVFGYIDHTDSLQIVWTQSYYSSWYAVFAKRVNTYGPFDTTQRSDHAELTPRTAYGPFGIRSVSDSLFAVTIAYPGVPYQAQLNLYRRSTYEEIAHIPLGGAPSVGDMALEGDSILSVMSGADSSEEPGIYLKRFRIPGLEVVQDTLIVRRPPSQGLGLRAYGMSSTGTRHLLYRVQVAPSGPGSTQLWYRYSPYAPDAVVSRAPIIGEEYILYPNPTNGTITLTGPLHRIKSARLYNVLGQCVQTYPTESGALRGSTFSLPMDNLPSGTYYLRLQESHRILTKSIQFTR